MGAAWSNCSPIALTLFKRLEHISVGYGQKFRHKQLWWVFVSNDDIASHVLLYSLKKSFTTWSRFLSPLAPGGRRVHLPVCAWRSSESWFSITQQEATGLGCYSMALGVLVPVRQVLSPRVILRLWISFALEAPWLDSLGLSGEGLFLPCQLQTGAPYRARSTAQPGLPGRQSPFPGGRPHGFSVWP